MRNFSYHSRRDHSEYFQRYWYLLVPCSTWCMRWSCSF
jgi:hypothetical protein